MVKERYTVDSVVCDYGIFENGELIEKLIFNSSANAKLVCKIMNLDADHKIIGEGKMNMKDESLDSLICKFLKESYKKIHQLDNDDPDREYCLKLFNSIYDIYKFRKLYVPEIEIEKEYECIWETSTRSDEQ